MVNGSMPAGNGVRFWHSVRWLLAGMATSLMLCGCSQEVPAQDARASFEYVVVDSQGPRDPWGKSFGDLNGDARPDLIVGGHAGGGLVWYENPDWRRHSIRSTGAFGTDHEVADIDGDGRNDVVNIMGNQLVWLRNNGKDDWEMMVVDEVKLHDVEVADLNGDGRPDIVARGQSAFGGGGDRLYLYLQRPGGKWQAMQIKCPQGEGLKLADLDADGHVDIIINGLWYRNPGKRGGPWQSYRYTSTWTWPHAFVVVGDMNGDGRLDIVLAPAELAGQKYRISWFEAPAVRTREWVEHVVEADAEAAHHFVGVADMDLDGRSDIVTALMHQAKGPAQIKLYLNLGGGRAWLKQVIASKGSHSMRLVDVNGDGAVDLFGANWSGDRQPVELWMNRACAGSAGTRWRRHVVDAERPRRAAFILAADLNGDQLVDLASGGWWYQNPGRAAGAWERRAFGAPVNDVAAIVDLDGDGDLDVFASQWRGEDGDTRFAWAENDGHAGFVVHQNIPAGSGDFLQGVATGRFTQPDRLQIALSWHAAGKGIEMFTVPAHPGKQPWLLEQIAKVSQDEALSAGDIDRDGRLDLLLGTTWLRNQGGLWRDYPLDMAGGNPDRNRLADINGDGQLDAVVGFEAISKSGDVVWYEQGRDPARQWVKHHIGSVIGPMSLDVTDIDGDGDLDVIVGEHNLKDPGSARLIAFINLDGRGGAWRMDVLYTGDEHHDGTLAVDVDGDGDIDIVSIGWGHNQVLWYENLGRHCLRP